MRVLGVVVCATAAAAAVAQRQQSVTISYIMTHLSPLIQYSPSGKGKDNDKPAAWNVSRAGHRSTTPGAAFSVDFTGSGLYIFGKAANISARDRNLERTPSYYEVLPHVGDVPIILRFGSLGVLEQQEQAPRITLDESSEGHSQFIDVQDVQVLVDVPAQPDHNWTRVSAINLDNSTNSFFSDPRRSWHIYTPDFNNSANFMQSFPWAPDTGRYGPLLLSTGRPDSPLQFTVPKYTSLLQWHGTVGPSQGSYELRLIPRSPLLDFKHPLVYRYDARSEISAIEELKAAALLDPRIHYDAEIILTDRRKGARADLHGIWFTRYTESAEGMSDWWTKHFAAPSRTFRLVSLASCLAVLMAVIVAVWYTIRMRRADRNEYGTIGEQERLIPAGTHAGS